MKKIEKTLAWYCARCYEPLEGYGTHWCLPERIDKIVELLERNQSVSQPEEDKLPEPVMRETIKPSWGDTELVFEKCDKNFLKSIVENNTEVHPIEWTGEYDNKRQYKEYDAVAYLKQGFVCCNSSKGNAPYDGKHWQTLESYKEDYEKDNMKEWKKGLKHLILQLSMNDYDLAEEEISEFIEQLLSERSFSKEELFLLSHGLGMNGDEFGLDEEDKKLMEKVDRLLSLDSK